MSDYFSDIDDLRLDLPLFKAATAVEEARDFHKRDEAQQDVLVRLRSGVGLTKFAYERAAKNGSRLAPAIEQLRNAHGFYIGGDGSAGDAYVMADPMQRPTLARVTPDMKAAYYQTPHWQSVREKRFAKDGRRCVLCDALDELRCHHVSYLRIFCEPPEDLMTLCDRCHGRVHEHCRLKFPSGVSVQYAHWLGWRGFEPWLLP